MLGGGAVATPQLAATEAPSASPSGVAASALPSTSPAITPISGDSVRTAGGCDDSGICRLMDVGVTHAVPFTPSIRCASTGETCRLHFEIYAPTSGGPRPLIVLEPGGNIPPGDPGDYLDQMATALAGRGAVVMIG